MMEIFFALFISALMAFWIYFSVQLWLYQKNRLDEERAIAKRATSELHELLTSKSLEDYRVWCRVQELQSQGESAVRRRDSEHEAEIAGTYVPGDE